MTTQGETLTIADAWSRGDMETIRRVLLRIAMEAREKAHGVDTKYSRQLTELARMSPMELARNNEVLSKFTDTRPVVSRGLTFPEDVMRMVDGFIMERDHMDELTAHGLAPASRILLTGAPGTGKTSLAGHIARRLELPLLTVRTDRLIDSLLGKTLSNVGLLFDHLDRTPCVAFLDEADALLASRALGRDVAEIRRMTNLLLQRLDGWNPQGVLVAATNMRGLLDPAALRRFDLRIELPPVAGDRVERIIMTRLGELDMPWDGEEPVNGMKPHVLSVLADMSPALVVQTVDRTVRRLIIDGRTMIRWEDLTETVGSVAV